MSRPFGSSERRHGRRLTFALGAAALALSGLAAPLANAAGGEGPVMSMSHATADRAAAPKAALAPDEVAIRNFTFVPKILTVAAGTRVVWTNDDESPHTIVSGDDPRVFKSSPLDTSDAFAFVFDKPGTYHYFCSLHPMMQGTVIVK